jgi:hypothetical protein
VAYTNTYQKKRAAYIIRVYGSVKHYDIPDSFIVRNIFPKHGIFISYRQWMNYKNKKQKEAAAIQLGFNF